MMSSSKKGHIKYVQIVFERLEKFGVLSIQLNVILGNQK